MSLEQDISKLMEDDIFKGADATEVAKRKVEKEKRLLAARLARKEICPGCDEDLRETGVYSTEIIRDEITRNYEWNKDINKWEETDVDHTHEYSGDDEEWHCANCDEKLNEGEDFVINEAEETKIFKGASEEDLEQRPGWVAKREEQKREAEEAERQRVQRERELETGDYITTKLVDASGRKPCDVCGRKVAKGKKYLAINYSTRWGRSTHAICKQCMQHAVQRMT